MPFGINEAEKRGLLDIWFSEKKAKRCKVAVDFCLDAFTVRGLAAVGAVASDSIKSEVCEYGGRKIGRIACTALLTPAAAASVGSVLMGWNAVTKTSKIYKTGSFLWNGGMTTLKAVGQGVTLPQQGISLLLCGRTYTPLVHNQTLLNSTNTTAITEGFKEGLTLVNATALKEAAKNAIN